MKSEPYGAFAYAYDKALGERFFRAARAMLTRLLARYPTEVKTHLDVACGTGLAVEFFTSRGFRSVGIDASLPMLAVARSRRVPLVAGDFHKFPFRATFSRVTCLYDSLNHIKNRVDLTSAFRAVRGVMNPDSLFFFDMNHPEVYPEVWGMKEPYVATGSDFHLEIATAFRKRDATGLALVTGWALLPDGTRAEISERHEQRAWTEREISTTLDEAGLEIVDVLDFDPYDEVATMDAAGVKLFFVCRAH